ncbi:MAG: SigB/SigF/SigG family RNA polymerase sigma factor [Clostridia bacterium]|nr:SigB/SigF/SigG family RNA polymerase sigma factor [Clostridia bacterium]MBR4260875.1 SigB/SigF/SigG family RNA polymerase sigma factor [Clostridia bacterium]
MYENSVEDIIKAKNGNEEAMTKLINSNSGLIWSIVRRFKDRGYELEDLYQIGSLGFIKSIRRFDTNFEVQLSTYAVPYILGEIKRFIRDDGPIKVSRSIKELCVKIREVQKEYMNKKGEEITIDEVSKILKVSKEDIAAALDSINCVDSIYDVNYKDENDGNILDKIPANDETEKNIVDKIVLKDAINKLNEREQKIILLRYFRGSTQCQVAKMLGISQVQVSRIEKKILLDMKEMLAV